MPPLIRRSQSAVPRHASEDGGHSGLGSHPTARHGSTPSSCAAGSPQRSVTGPAAADARIRARCHPGRCPAPSPGRPPRPSPSWPLGARPLAELAISTGLFPGPARGGEDTRQRTQPGQAPVNGLLPVRIAAHRVRELDTLRGDPDEVRARLSEHIPLRRYGEPEEFGWAAAFVLSPARVPHHRRDDPGGRRCHQLDLSTRSRAQPPGPRCRGI
jgi:hypothetical protein